MKKDNIYIKNTSLEPGLNENIIRKISKIRNEPLWLLNFRLNSFKIWKNMKEPNWINGKYPKIDYQKYIYYTVPYKKNKLKNNFFTNEIKYLFNKLNVPIKDKKTLAVDAIFDSTSVYTTCQKILNKYNILFCSFNDAVKKYSHIVKKYLGTVVNNKDNFFASLNSSIFSDGTFIYIPKNTKCPIDLSTYFRIHSKITNQFERTLIIINKNSYLSYIEGCTANVNNINQLHAAVVEIIVLDNSEIKYSTIQNWYYGNTIEEGILNFVTKRSLCKGKKSKTSWIQIEIGSSVTWKYPSVILKGDDSIGEFFSISIVSKNQQTDTGTKMIHIGKNTKSNIISKSISLNNGKNTYRGMVKILEKACNSKNYSKCDSLIIGNKSSSHSFPLLESKNNSSKIEHETFLLKINEDQLFYLQQRCFSEENAIYVIINSFCHVILNKLPLEFLSESKELLFNLILNNLK